MLTPATASEMELLENIDLRRSKHAANIIKISDRSFDGGLRLEEFTWENLEFENCDFVNCLMYRGVMRNVKFNNCLFFANTWRDSCWESVSFYDCAWRGPFRMGASDGKDAVHFQKCEFIGAAEGDLGYGGKVEHFGSIGGTNGKIIYEQCDFERSFINGGLMTECRKCNMRDVVVYGKERSEISFENVTASGLVDLSNNNFSLVKFRESRFAGRLKFEATHIGSAVFESIKANLDLTLVIAQSVVLHHVTFIGSSTPNPHYQYGLICESSKIKSLTVEECSFEGFGARINLSGEETSEDLTIDSSPLPENAYSTDIQDLLIRATPVENANFKYMRIKNFTMENLRITSADFSRSAIGRFFTNNVTVAGDLFFKNVTIKKVEGEIYPRATN